MDMLGQPLKDQREYLAFSFGKNSCGGYYLFRSGRSFHDSLQICLLEPHLACKRFVNTFRKFLWRAMFQDNAGNPLADQVRSL